MSTRVIDIKNLPTLGEIEELIIAKRQEMAELRKLRSLASLREKAKPPAIVEHRLRSREEAGHAPASAP